MHVHWKYVIYVRPAVRLSGHGVLTCPDSGLPAACPRQLRFSVADGVSREGKVETDLLMCRAQAKFGWIWVPGRVNCRGTENISSDCSMSFPTLVTSGRPLAFCSADYYQPRSSVVKWFDTLDWEHMYVYMYVWPRRQFSGLRTYVCMYVWPRQRTS